LNFVSLFRFPSFLSDWAIEPSMSNWAVNGGEIRGGHWRRHRWWAEVRRHGGVVAVSRSEGTERVGSALKFLARKTWTWWTVGLYFMWPLFLVFLEFLFAHPTFSNASCKFYSPRKTYIGQVCKLICEPCWICSLYNMWIVLLLNIFFNYFNYGWCKSSKKLKVDVKPNKELEVDAKVVDQKDKVDFCVQFMTKEELCYTRWDDCRSWGIK
jgi:hypothetical protein